MNWADPRRRRALVALAALAAVTCSSGQRGFAAPAACRGRECGAALGAHIAGQDLARIHQQKGVACLPQRGCRLPLQAVPVVPLLATSTLPTCLGFWRSEYGVSFGYGGAMAASGALLLRGALPATVAAHALCLVLFGTRLNLFLGYREFLPRFRKFREKIEDRARSRGGRLKRLPFILGCSLLYLGMAAPAVLAVEAAGPLGATSGCPCAALFPVCVSAMYFGWALAATGDAWKSARKAAKGEKYLVTGGPFAFLRHPNYTGEQLLWSANFAAGLLAFLSRGRAALSVGSFAWLVLSSLGYAGIMFVLMQATRGLEARQKETYSADPSYGEWVSRTWAGLALPPKKEEKWVPGELSNLTINAQGQLRFKDPSLASE